MPTPQYTIPNLAVLRWARDSAGLSVADAARKLRVKPLRLEAWETGDLRPTVRQLREIARVYKRPLATFFLPEPPIEPEPPRDFRRMSQFDNRATSPNLRLEIRRAIRRRRIAQDLMAEAGDLVDALLPTASPTDSPDDVAAACREWLRIDLASQSRWKGDYDALNGWIGAVEARGILIFQTSDVALDEMRGFSINESILPVVVLNGQDHPRGRVFTLMHELTHLMIRQSGVCEPIKVGQRGRTPEERVEVFCNRVAGATLVPANALLSEREVQSVHQPTEWDEDVLRSLARKFAVSREVILRRLLILGKTTHAFYARRHKAYQDEYVQERQRRRTRPAPVPRPIMVMRNNGRIYTRAVLDALEQDRITDAELSDYLSMRLRHLDNLADLARMQRVEV